MEHIYLTYDEAADRLGIKADSVRRRARARKWPRRTGNDGKAQVGVPKDILEADTPSGPPSGPPPGAPSAPHQDTEALRVEIRMLRERLEELRNDRDNWQAQAERLNDLRDDRDKWKAEFEKLDRGGSIGIWLRNIFRR